MLPKAAVTSILPAPSPEHLDTIRNREGVGNGGEMGNTVLDQDGIEFLSLFKWQDPKPTLTSRAETDSESPRLWRCMFARSL